MTNDGDRHLSPEEKVVDSHHRTMESDLRPSDGRRKPGSCMFAILWTGLTFTAAFGLLFVINTRLDLLASDSEPLNASDTESAVADQGAASNEQSSETAGPIRGTWAMYWTNIEGNEKVGFTLRFMDDEYGTVEFPYDDRAYDGRWDINGDQISFGFARDFDGPSGSVTEWSSFEGTLVKPDLITGNWLRDDWSCTPDDGCSTKPVPTSSDSRLVRQP